MGPNKILVVFLVLIVGICFADVAIKTSESSVSHELMDATVDILASCYGDRGPIGVLGNVPRTLLRKMSKKLIPVILFNTIKRTTRYGVMNRESPKTTVHTFLYIAISSKQIAREMFATYNFRWLNPSASILMVIALPNRKDGCTKVISVMYPLANSFVHNVNVLCSDAKNRLAIFAFNPYRNQAPPPWEFIRYFEHGKVSFFVFGQLYQAGNGICNSLDYDQTKNLGGKAIYFYGNSFLPTTVDYTRMSRLDLRYATYSNFWKIYLRQMNATMTQRQNGGGLNMQPQDLNNVGFLRKSMPIFQHPRVIVTQLRGYKSQLCKILTVVDKYSQYCVGLTLFIILIFFKVFAHQHLIPGILNVIRMICNTGFTNLPMSVPTRIYLACLFLFIVTIQGIFSGDLASLLTTSIPIRHARTVEDLIDMNYMIYIDSVLKKFLKGVKNNRHFIEPPFRRSCVYLVLRDASNACIDSKDFVMDIAKKFKLYTSNDIFTTYLTIDYDFLFPFADRTTEIFLRMTDARILEPLYVKVKQIRLDEIQQYGMECKPPRVMNLDDLGFAFVILGIGLGCAVLSFIIEISINPVRSRIAKVRRYFRH